MLNFMYVFSYTIIIMFSTIYVWHKLLDKQIDFKNYKLYVTLFALTLIIMLNTQFSNKFIRILIATISLMPFFKFLFNENFHKSIITPIFTQIITFLSEFIYSIVLVLILGGESEKINTITFGPFITNLVIALMIFISSKFKITKKLYKNLLDMTDKIKPMQLSLFCIVGMLILNIFLMGSYYKIEFEYFLTINVITIIGCSLIIFYSFKTQNKYNKVSDKYNVAAKSLNDYEDMMTKYRVANHENKNLLLTVRTMILNKEENIPSYIDSMIKQKYLDDEKLLFETSVIPTGGLRATIYSEILKIKENNIKYSLNIDKEIRTVDLINLDTDDVVGVCKIIGVFIDNSIQAVNNLKKKNINIDLYLEDNNLNIKVSNNYKGIIDINKIKEEGYTTKGKGHGYGLSLVEKIVKSNNNIENKTEVSKDIFSQVLIIKYKKST